MAHLTDIRPAERPLLSVCWKRNSLEGCQPAEPLAESSHRDAFGAIDQLSSVRATAEVVEVGGLAHGGHELRLVQARADEAVAGGGAARPCQGRIHPQFLDKNGLGRR
jgi:hypothetical protein